MESHSGTHVCSNRDKQVDGFLQLQIWRNRSKGNRQIAVRLGEISLPCATIMEEDVASIASTTCIPTLFKLSLSSSVVRTRLPVHPEVQLQSREHIFKPDDAVRVHIDGQWFDAFIARDQSECPTGKLWVCLTDHRDRDAVSWYSLRPADPPTQETGWSKKARWQLLLCCLDKCYEPKRRVWSKRKQDWCPFRTMQVGQEEDRRRCLEVYDQIITYLSTPVHVLEKETVYNF